MGVRSKLGSFGKTGFSVGTACGTGEDAPSRSRFCAGGALRGWEGWVWGWLGFGWLRAGGDEGVEALDRFLVADAEAGFVAGHAVDLGARVAPSDTEEHVGDVALVTGAVVGGVEFVEEVAGGVRVGMLVEGELAVEVEESGFGADEVLETDFAEGDFRDCCFFERGLGKVMVEVAGDAIGDLLRGFGVVVESGVVGAEAVFEGVQRGR